MSEDPKNNSSARGKVGLDVTSEQIAQWEEEIIQLKHGTEWYEFLKEYNFGRKEPIPTAHVSAPQRIVEILLEIAPDDMKKISGWEDLKTEIGIITDADPQYKDCPRESYRLLEDFVDWYCFKTSTPREPLSLGSSVINLVREIINGNIDNVWSRDAVEMLLNYLHRPIFTE